MAEVDTSSYPKAAPPPDFLGQIQKIQGLKSGQLTIQKQHLDLMNQGYEYLNRELNSLGPNPSKDEFLNMGQNAVKLGLVQPDQWATVASQVSDDPTKNAALRDQVASKLMNTAEAANFHLGTPGYVNNGQTTTPVRTFPRGGPVASGPPIQNQLPPETPVNVNGQPKLLGAQAPQLPEGATPAPGGIPGQIAPQGQTAPTNRLGAAVQPPQQPAQAPQGQGGGYKAAGPNTAASPLYDTGKAQYVADQELSAQKQTALKPLLQALPLIKQIRTGPTTAGFNNVVATLKANGILSTADTNDPTAVYQEVNKKLSQYVQNSGSRSDAQQALNEESSPNAKTQIQPALLKLVQDQIPLDRIQAARSAAFKSKDYSTYGDYKAKFPSSVDEKAFGLDLMDPDKRASLVSDMAGKLKSKSSADKAGATRFFSSLRIAKDQGYYNEN